MTVDLEKLETKHSRIGVGSHTALGIIMGYISIFITAMIGNIAAVVIGFALVVASGYLIERFIGKKGMKWWFGNGIIVYVLIWLVAWTFFLNLPVA